MPYLFIFILLMLNIIFGIIIFNITRKLNSQKDQYKKEYIYKKQSQFDKQFQQLEEELKLKEQSVKKANEIISNQQQHIREIKATQEELINSEKEKINRIIPNIIFNINNMNINKYGIKYKSPILYINIIKQFLEKVKF